MRRFLVVLFLGLALGGWVAVANADHRNYRHYNGGDYRDGVYCPNNMFRAACQGFVPRYYDYGYERRYDNYRPYSPPYRRHYHRDYYYSGGVTLCFFCREY